MTPGEIHMQLTMAQLAQQQAFELEHAPLLWTQITPTDDSGRSFCICVCFEYGPSKDMLIEIDASINVDAAILDRLNAAIIDAAPTRWHH
jgi:hypothetical protein